jgi:hypothetical protein
VPPVRWHGTALNTSLYSPAQPTPPSVSHHIRSCFCKQSASNDENFCSQTRRFSAAILSGLQGKATQYAGKKAVRAVCNAYENGF